MTRVQKLRLYFLIGILAFLIYGFFNQLYTRAAQSDSVTEELLQSGVNVKAKVVKTYRVSAGPKSHITYVEVNFSVGNEQISAAYPIGFLPDIRKSADENFPSGLELDVMYLPSAPTTIVIPSLKQSTLTKRQEVAVLIGLGIVPFIVGCWLCIRTFRKRE